MAKFVIAPADDGGVGEGKGPYRTPIGCGGCDVESGVVEPQGDGSGRRAGSWGDGAGGVSSRTGPLAGPTVTLLIVCRHIVINSKML